MEFDEHEDQDEEIGMEQLPQNYDSTGRPRVAGGGGGEGVSTAASGRKVGVRYKECLKNHAVGIGGNAVDGCGEFMAAGDEGTLDGLKCAACNCHRNFHRKETEGEGLLQHHQLTAPYYHRGTTHPSGYLHVTPMSHQRPLALPSISRDDMEDMSNPSSSGGGGVGSGSSRKRFRTKFTAEQKEKMLELAERLGWRIQKQDEAVVQHFCEETGVKRHVLKVWMHNNKHTLGKKLP